MADVLLEMKDLYARVEDNEILKGIGLTVKKGETHVLLGPNGAGKSTLGNVIMGNPTYEVTKGTVTYNGEDLLDMPVNERAKKGIFMSFQNPLEVAGISMVNFLRNAEEQRTGEHTRLWDFRKKLREKLSVLKMDEAYADRDLNVGFSGGEKKKAEILQMLMLDPTLAILDETDSGLDVDAVRIVSEGIREFQKDPEKSLIIITHNAAILSSLKVDAAHVLVDGRIVKDGDRSLVDEIAQNGFADFE